MCILERLSSEQECWSDLFHLLLQHLYLSVTKTWLRLNCTLWTPSVTCTAHTLNNTAKVPECLEDDFNLLGHTYNNLWYWVWFFALLIPKGLLSLSGVKPPRPRPPSINGNLQMIERPVICATGYRMRRSPMNQLSNMWASKWCYSLAIMLILLIVILILSFLGEGIYIYI